MILYQTLKKERRKGRRHSLTLSQVRMREAKRHVDHINRVLGEHDMVMEKLLQRASMLPVCSLPGKRK